MEQAEGGGAQGTDYYHDYNLILGGGGGSYSPPRETERQQQQQRWVNAKRRMLRNMKRFSIALVSIVCAFLLCLTFHGISRQELQQQHGDTSSSVMVVELPIYENQYLVLYTGNPGKYITYRIDYQLNFTYLYTDPSSFSKTYESMWHHHGSSDAFEIGEGSKRGTEVLYFRTFKVRMPVVFERPTSDYVSALYHGVDHQGVLGLGRGSVLWRYWHWMTTSRDSLMLGRYSDRDTAYSTGGEELGNALYKGLVLPRRPEHQRVEVLSTTPTSDDDDANEHEQQHHVYRLSFDPTSEVTLFPPDLYHQQLWEFCLQLKSEESLSYVYASMDDFHVVTTSGQYLYHMVDICKDPSDALVIGRSYIDQNLVVFWDWIDDTVRLQDNYARGYVDESRDFNLYMALLLVASYVVWLIGVHSNVGERTSEKVRVFFLLVQAYCLVLVLATLLYNVFGIHCSRLMVHHLHGYNARDPDHTHLHTDYYVYYRFCHVIFVIHYVSVLLWNAYLIFGKTKYFAAAAAATTTPPPPHLPSRYNKSTHESFVYPLHHPRHPQRQQQHQQNHYYTTVSSNNTVLRQRGGAAALAAVAGSDSMQQQHVIINNTTTTTTMKRLYELQKHGANGWYMHGEATLLRRAAFEWMMVLAVWTTFLEFHDSYYGVLFMLPVSTYGAVMQVTSFLQSVSRRTRWILAHALLSFVSLMFLLFFNLLVYAIEYYHGYPYYGLGILFFINITVFLPSMLLRDKIERSRILYRVRQLLIITNTAGE